MAARYLIDTNICIYISKRHPPEVLERFKHLQVGTVAMSLITYGELRYGAEKSRYHEQALEKLAGLVELVPVLPMGPDVGQHYGSVRNILARSGTPIGANDLWIAAHVRGHNWQAAGHRLDQCDREPFVSRAKHKIVKSTQECWHIGAVADQMDSITESALTDLRVEVTRRGQKVTMEYEIR